MKLEEIKKNMHHNVRYDGGVYYFDSCVLWLDEVEREFKYSLWLIDKQANCAYQVPIEKVEVINDEL